MPKLKKHKGCVSKKAGFSHILVLIGVLALIGLVGLGNISSTPQNVLGENEEAKRVLGACLVRYFYRELLGAIQVVRIASLALYIKLFVTQTTLNAPSVSRLGVEPRTSCLRGKCSNH